MTVSQILMKWGKFFVRHDDIWQTIPMTQLNGFVVDKCVSRWALSRCAEIEINIGPSIYHDISQGKIFSHIYQGIDHTMCKKGGFISLLWWFYRIKWTIIHGGIFGMTSSWTLEEPNNMKNNNFVNVLLLNYVFLIVRICIWSLFLIDRSNIGILCI